MKDIIYKYYDISPPVSQNTAVWPNDISCSKNSKIWGEDIMVSAITSTVHIGAHADAPLHYVKNGLSIGECNIKPYIGTCQVIRITKHDNGKLYPHHFNDSPITSKRVLISTDSIDNPDKWQDNFTTCSVDLIKYLAEKKVILLGIDTPSIDPPDAKDLAAHKCCYSHGISILEGLLLRDIKPSSSYELIALPLRLMGFDASPVRAVLRVSTNDKP